MVRECQGKGGECQGNVCGKRLRVGLSNLTTLEIRATSADDIASVQNSDGD